MKYARPLSDQVLIFIISIGFGAILGLLYEVFAVLRRLAGNKLWPSVICDFTFCAISAALSFFYMIIYNSGTVRLNLIIAQLIGGLAFHFGMGIYLRKPLYLITDVIRKILKWTFYPFNKLLSKIKSLFEKTKKHMHKSRNDAKTR